MKLYSILIILSLTFVLSCSKKSNSKKIFKSLSPVEVKTKNESLSYQIKIGLCDTGLHKFESTEKYCQALQDDTLNNGCALENRKEMYAEKCASYGEFVSKNLLVNETDKKTITKSNQDKTFDLQISVLSFLQGGKEPCAFNNQIMSFSLNDQNKEKILCKNSKIKVSMESNLGIITFKVIDLQSNVEITEQESYSEGQTFDLEGEKRSLRFGPINPYGFTHVIVEDVTGIDRELLKQWNELNTKASAKKAKLIELKKAGKEIPNELITELKEIKKQQDELAEKMYKTQSKQ